MGFIIKRLRRLRGHRDGQTVVEYMILAVMLLFCITIMAVFLFTFREYGSRVLDLVASDFP